MVFFAEQPRAFTDSHSAITRDLTQFVRVGRAAGRPRLWLASPLGSKHVKSLWIPAGCSVMVKPISLIMTLLRSSTCILPSCPRPQAPLETREKLARRHCLQRPARDSSANASLRKDHDRRLTTGIPQRIGSSCGLHWHTTRPRGSCHLDSRRRHCCHHSPAARGSLECSCQREVL
jgi:hypothetical protein